MPNVGISAAGVALSFGLGDGAPWVTHWGPALRGPDLADQLAATSAPAVMHSSFDAPRIVSVLPGEPDGWSGTPALELSRGRRAVQPRLVVEDVDAQGDAVRFALADATAGVAVDLRYRLGASGVLFASAVLRNTAPDSELSVAAVRLLLPLPDAAA